MISKTLYAIIDLESKWFVTRDMHSKLDELGSNTKFFESKSEAMRFIEKPIEIDLGVNQPTMLQNNLAWWLLEKVYKKDRWFINCSKQELNDALNNVSRLKVVSVKMEYNPDVH